MDDVAEQEKHLHKGAEGRLACRGMETDHSEVLWVSTAGKPAGCNCGVVVENLAEKNTHLVVAVVTVVGREILEEEAARMAGEGGRG